MSENCFEVYATKREETDALWEALMNKHPCKKDIENTNENKEVATK